ncbi:protoporphyrinogen oxidase [Halobacteriaceae bacterium SHR40]|uniref:protoporphyrinogen oxidase n=1 Tax=Halovenus amylolytica TaxID=2500550 RepID=UPI000FE40C40
MRVGIVGAGITGLALTHYLAAAGIDSVAFEASDEAGGVINTRHTDGKVLEAGPQRMRKTPGIEELATAAGIEDEFVEASEEQLFVYADGELGRAPLSTEEFFETDLLSWRGKLRLLAEPLTRPGMEQETARDLFVRKFGQEAYEKFIGPLYGGIYGSDPAEMPAAYALDSLMEREQEAGSFLQAFRKRVGSGQKSPPVSFRQGMQQLPNALAEVYSDRIEMETPVIDIAEKDGGYELTTSNGTEFVDHLVVTTPADVTAALLGNIVTGAEELDELRYNPLALVYLDADPDLEGFGYQVGYGEDLHTLGVSWNASMFDRDGVHTVFLGGMHEPELVERSDERLGEIAREEFEGVVGAEASVIDIARLDVGFPAWDQSWWTLEELETPEGIDLATNYTARMGVPSRVREASKIATKLEAQHESESPSPSAADGTPTRATGDD